MRVHTQQFEDDLTTISVFTSFVSILMGLVYYAARTGFENPPAPVISAVGIALFVLNAPTFARRIRQQADDWYTSAPALLIAAMAVLAGVGAAIRLVPALQGAAFVMVGVGILIFVINVAVWLRGGRVLPNLLFVLGVAIFTAWLSAVVWNGEYRSPIFMERIVADLASGDVPWHAAIVAMLDTHAASSVGYQGLVPLQYHIGSHVLFVPLTHLVNVTPFTFYQLGFPVIMVPLFECAILTAALYIRALYASPMPARPLRTDLLLWVAFTVMQVGVQRIKENVGGYDGFLVFSSESFMLGMTLLSLAVALCARFAAEPEVQQRQFNQWRSRAFVLIALPLLAGAMGVSKISVMYGFVAICGYFFVRLGLFRHRLFVAGMLIMLVVFVMVYRMVQVELATIVPFGLPFQYLFDYHESWSRPFFYVTFYAYSWLFILLRLAITGARTLRDVWQQLRRNELLDVEFVLIAAAASALPGMLGLTFAEFYFSLIQRSVALIFVVAAMPLIARFLSLRPAGSTLGSVSLRNLVVALAFAFYLLAIPDQFRVHIQRFVEVERDTFAVFSAEGSDQPMLNSLKSALAARDVSGIQAALRDQVIPYLTTHQQYAEQNPRYRLLRALQAIGEIPASEKRNGLIFIPKSNHDFWGVHIICENATGLAPGLTGMPMLQGIPPATCEKQTFGYMDYRVIERHDYAITDEDAMCIEARELGFGEVWVIDDDASIHKIVCD